MIVTEGGGISKTLSASQCWSNASWVGFFLYCSRHCGATETVRQGRSPLRHYNELNFKDLNIWWKKKISDLGEYSITRREDLKDLMLLAAASLAEGWNRWDCAEAHAALQQHICSPVFHFCHQGNSQNLSSFSQEPLLHLKAATISPLTCFFSHENLHSFSPCKPWLQSSSRTYTVPCLYSLWLARVLPWCDGHKQARFSGGD